jgi:excisionase family DNA binding protein
MRRDASERHSSPITRSRAAICNDTKTGGCCVRLDPQAAGLVNARETVTKQLATGNYIVRPNANAGGLTDAMASSLSIIDQPLLTAAEIGVLLGGVPAKTSLQYAREGRLPCVRIGKHVRFVRGDVDQALAALRTPASRQ